VSASGSRTPNRLLLGVVGCLTGLGSALAIPAVAPQSAGAEPIADAEAQAAQLTNQIAAEGKRANALSEEYDAARLKVSSLDGQIWTDEAQITATQQRVKTLKQRVRAQAVTAFVDQGSGSSISVVFDSGQRDIALKEHYLGVAANQSVSAIDSLRATQDTLASQEAKLQVARSQAHDALAAISSDEQAVQAVTAKEQATLSQVKGNIANLVAEQQQAQAAARQRTFLAQVASEQQAARSAQAGPAQGSGSVSSAGGAVSPPAHTVSPPPARLPAPPPPAPAPAPSRPAPSGGGRGSVAVAAAESLEGVPYVWGGASRSGVDCSGLVMLAWEAAGVYLPHYSGAQWSAVAHVSAGDLQPGDIIFYGPGGSDHEALYVGGGMEVEALHTGTVVGLYPVGYAGTPSGYGRP
jgi:peptidoglycan DL-endopeptidase CwlO